MLKLGTGTWKSNKTYKNVLACGRVIWDMACADDPKVDNPLAKTDFLPVQRLEPDPFTLDEIELILAELRKRCGLDGADYYYELAFFSGPAPERADRASVAGRRHGERQGRHTSQALRAGSTRGEELRRACSNSIAAHSA